MKIYTGRGDNGTAGLISGERILKSHDRIEALGDIDELISVLGLLRIYLTSDCKEKDDELRRIQTDLFDIGTLVATWRDSPAPSKCRQIGSEHIRWLESAIDYISSQVPVLEHFLLPFGHPTAVWAHFARTICRRAERHFVKLSVEAMVGKPPKLLRWAIIYLNRLSDYLFVAGRYGNHMAGIPDDILIRRT